MIPKTGARLGFIDSIRGIAACLVMLQHSLYQSGLLGDWPNSRLTGFLPNRLELGETGVVAFFLVSGFVIPLSLEKTNDFLLFWIHRIFRLYPLYIFTFIITFLSIKGGEILSSSQFLFNILCHIFFIQEYTNQENFVAGSWTLSLEIIWYIGISVFFLLSLHKKSCLIVGLAMLVSMVAQAARPFGLYLPMGRLSMLVCCVLGLVCYRRDSGEVKTSEFIAFAAILAVTIASNLFVGLFLFPSPHPTASFTMAADSWFLAMAVFFIPFMTRRMSIWNHGFLRFLGQISFSVYLLHGVVLFLLKKTPLGGVLIVCLTFIVTIAASFLTYKYIEAPFIRLGHMWRSQDRTGQFRRIGGHRPDGGQVR